VKRYCRVTVDSPVTSLDRPFDYRIPDRMLGRVDVGSVVRVPLHGRRIRGYVTELLDTPEVDNPKSLSMLVSPTPLFDEVGVELARWVARRYATPTGVVLHQAAPGRYSLPDTPDEAVVRPTSTPPRWLDAERLQGSLASGGHLCLQLGSVTQETDAVAYAATLAAHAGKQTLGSMGPTLNYRKIL
jgi:primosomal protein N'